MTDMTYILFPVSFGGELGVYMLQIRATGHLRLGRSLRACVTSIRLRSWNLTFFIAMLE